MVARAYPKTGDPRLKTASYRAILRYWQALKPEQCEADRCLLPGRAITYTVPRTQTSMDVGHVVPRLVDTRRTWVVADTRPEHQRCNRAAGLAEAKRRGANGGRTPTRSPRLLQPADKGERSITAGEW
jgi:5-methylcytosine-specific restriction endonuclease McrA